VTLTETQHPDIANGRLPRLLPAQGEPSRQAHLDRVGPMPQSGRHLIAAVTAAGLRGRGGASFPTGTKMNTVAAAPGSKVVVANGTEGEPLSAKDRTLLSANPHIVLDGIAAAAAAVGARRALLCVKRGQPELLAVIRRAVAERHDDVPVEVRETPDRFIAGQETALCRWINGGDARPVFGQRPYQRGVDGRATLVDNVETLAHVGLIARFGADWFRRLGTDQDPGSALVTVSGGVERPGVYEIPLGLPARQLFEHVGSRPASAVLLGGYFGRWVDPRRLDTAALSDAGLAAHQSRFGCGVIVVLPDDSCALAEVATVADWYAANSAGQCGACKFGLADIARAVRGLLTGDPDAEAAARRWTAMVRGRGACQFPDGAAMFVDSALDVLAPEIAAHRHGGCGNPHRHHLPAPTPRDWR
jgi:NADH:ubiquinone oxidoreductase subunit F (NADH-binding)